MGWQDYTVWLIGAAVAVLIFRRVLCLFRGRGRGGCAACGSTGCPLRRKERK